MSGEIFPNAMIYFLFFLNLFLREQYNKEKWDRSVNGNVSSEDFNIRYMAQRWRQIEIPKMSRSWQVV